HLQRREAAAVQRGRLEDARYELRAWEGAPRTRGEGAERQGSERAAAAGDAAPARGVPAAVAVSGSRRSDFGVRRPSSRPSTVSSRARTRGERRIDVWSS